MTTAILADGVIEDSEIESILHFCQSMSGMDERKVRKSPKKRDRNAVTVCFTGFGSRKKAMLMQEAEAKGFYAASSVINNLGYLVTGSEPGPSKLEQAREKGIKIIDLEAWNSMLGAANGPK